jgi:hypothetical protein
MALPPLLVKIGADATGLDKGLSASQASLAKFAKVGVAAAGAVGVAMIALTKESMAQIDAQAKLAQSMGTTVKSMQALQLAGSLAGVAMSGVQQATSDLTRRLAQAASGTGPVADALDRLGLSAVALSQVPLDERVLKINEALDDMVPAAQRAAVAGQLFGEEGSLAMARIDTATIRQAREDIVRFGVATSEVGANQVEAANDAVTRLGLAFTGLGNRMATAAAPAIEAVANGLIAVAANILGVKVRLDEFFGSLEQARKLLGEDVYNALVGNTEAIADNADALEGIRRAYGGIAPVVLRAQTDLENFADELGRVGEIGAEEVLNGLVREMSDLQSKFLEGKVSGEEYNAEMMRISARAEGLVTQLQNINGVGFQAAIASIGGLRSALGQALSTAMALRQTLPGGNMMDTGTGLSPDDPNLLPPGQFAPGSSLRPVSREQGRFNEFFGPEDASGGGGKTEEDMLREQMARRLEVLMESLMTERETVAQWYQEGQDLIQNATDAELAALGGKHEAMQRLEKEHQARLSRIRQLGAAADLNTLLGAGQEVLSAMGTHNKKALKVAQVFGAAQALISAYQGAAEALKGPFPGNIAAAATVLAKGIGFVSAIKGVNASGGGSTASSGGSSTATAPAAAAPAPAATQTLNFSVTNDPFGISDRLVRQIVGAINQSQRDGSTLIRATVS